MASARLDSSSVTSESVASAQHVAQHDAQELPPAEARQVHGGGQVRRFCGPERRSSSANSSTVSGRCSPRGSHLQHPLGIAQHGLGKKTAVGKRGDRAAQRRGRAGDAVECRREFVAQAFQVVQRLVRIRHRASSSWMRAAMRSGMPLPSRAMSSRARDGLRNSTASSRPCMESGKRGH